MSAEHDLKEGIKSAVRIMNGDRTAPLARLMEARAVLLASLSPVPRTVAELASDYGWGHADTGGGCTALEKEFFEGKYAYITDEASIPGDAKAACLLGFYDGTSSEPSFVFTCPDLETAMKTADMLTDI